MMRSLFSSFTGWGSPTRYRPPVSEPNLWLPMIIRLIPSTTSFSGDGHFQPVRQRRFSRRNDCAGEAVAVCTPGMLRRVEEFAEELSPALAYGPFLISLISISASVSRRCMHIPPPDRSYRGRPVHSVGFCGTERTIRLDSPIRRGNARLHFRIEGYRTLGEATITPLFPLEPAGAVRAGRISRVYRTFRP